MSDFEMIMVFNEAFNFLLSSFTTFLSIVFAFLVASTLLAARLTRTLAGIAVALFSVASVFFIALTRAVAGDVGSTAGQIKLAVAEGRSTLNWVGFVETSAPVGGVLQVMVPTLMALTFVAALVFFFHQRRTLATTR
jgi:hypothetical protein